MCPGTTYLRKVLGFAIKIWSSRLSFFLASAGFKGGGRDGSIKTPEMEKGRRQNLLAGHRLADWVQISIHGGE